RVTGELARRSDPARECGHGHLLRPSPRGTGMTEPGRHRETQALFERALRVVPGGIYGHQSPRMLVPDAYPYFFARGAGARIWDVDGNEYIDLMCSYGPIVLGHNHPRVDEAARRQAEAGRCFNGPGAAWVELAERLVELTPWAGWAVFAKNGSDVCTWATQVARAATGLAEAPPRGGAVPRPAPLVLADAGGRAAGGPRPHRAFPLQRPPERGRGARWARGRRGGDHGVALPPRRLPRPGAAGPRLPRRAAGALRPPGRGPDPGRRARRLPARLARVGRGDGRAARPHLLLQGARQRGPDRGGARPRRAPPSGREGILHRLVLDRPGRDGGRARLSRGAGSERRHPAHGAARDPAGRRDRAPGCG